MSQIITRFAPSPTGMLHIGGARTALFNYLFAKKNGGKFLLRIEDTDVARSTKEAKDAILLGMNWLKLQWDEDVVYQMEGQGRHKEVAEKLVAQGKAYYAYDDMEQIAKERASSKIYRYNPKWRNGDLQVPTDIKPTIRLKIPAGKTEWNDLVKGKIEFDNSEIEDFVLLRSDGVPTYMLAVVCDDIDMKITHVIRGDDHVSNTPKQILIYNAIGSKLPEFGHIPLIYDIEGQKLSKRKGAVAVGDYEKMGYLPEAINSYLMQLGWASKAAADKLMNLDEAAKVFDVSELGSSPSRFDFDKLNFINLQYLQSKTDDEILDIIKGRADRLLDDDELCAIKGIASEIKKCNTINDLMALGMLFTKNELKRDADAIKMIENNTDIKSKLFKVIEDLEKMDDFKQNFDDFLKVNSLKFGFVGPILRSILIGKTSSLGVKDIVMALGKNECLKRFNI